MDMTDSCQSKNTRGRDHNNPCNPSLRDDLEGYHMCLLSSGKGFLAVSKWPEAGNGRLTDQEFSH
jgi:hypothetical protein